MIAIVFIVLSVAWGIVGLVMLSFAANDVDGPPLALMGLIMIAAPIGLNAAAYQEQVEDLVTVRNQAQIVQIKEDAISRINSDLAELPKASALMNADSPAAALIKAKSDYITELTKSKDLVLQSRLNIEKRKLGPSAWATWILPSGNEIK